MHHFFINDNFDLGGGITYSNITESTEKSPLSRVQQSIEDEVDVDFINFYGNFVLMDARGVDCLDVVQYLVEQGAGVNIKNKGFIMKKSTIN